MFYGKRRIEKMMIRGAKVHNLKHIDVDIPLNQIVGNRRGIRPPASPPCSGSSVREGSRRYLDSLSTYTRRRMTQAAKAAVDEVLYVPAALALHQRPAIPGIAALSEPALSC